jgi:hypothetical protein
MPGPLIRQENLDIFEYIKTPMPSTFLQQVPSPSFPSVTALPLLGYLAFPEPLVTAEGGSLPTTDGFMVPEVAKLAAVRKGKGVMVGDYFVGNPTVEELCFDEQNIIY